MSTTRKPLGVINKSVRLNSHLVTHSATSTSVRKTRTSGDENFDIPTAKKAKTTKKVIDATPNKPITRLSDLEKTPIMSPTSALHAAKTPKVSRKTLDMLNQKESTTKPKRVDDALQLVELAPFKLDAESFNSYLYTGKMLIPASSAIAQEDEAAERSAQQSCNVNEPTSKNLFMANFDTIDEHDEELDALLNTEDQARVSVRQHAMEEEKKKIMRPRTTLMHTPLSRTAATPLVKTVHNTRTPASVTTRSTRNTPSAKANNNNEPRVVPIVVKYPLMGSWTEWKDSFQTCTDEVQMYREIKTWKCPYLLRYYGTHGPGVVFEFVDGEALDGFVYAPKDEFVKHTWVWSDLGHNVCTALLYLQGLKISHNDLKPENVRYSSSKGVWKLLDLGLATDLNLHVCRGIGTDGYRAPEVAATGHIHKNSDVYGFGIMMEDALGCIKGRYEVLCELWDEYAAVLKMADEESNAPNAHEEGEIDLERERVLILEEHVKSNSRSNVKVDVDNSTEVFDNLEQLNKMFNVMDDIVSSCLKQQPQDRPSIEKLITVFTALSHTEKSIAETLKIVLSMGIN